MNGEYNGRGRLTHKNRDIYHGDWKDGKAHGNGIFLDHKGNAYDGDWVNDQYHGKGKEQWDWGKQLYVGDYVQCQRTGKGLLTVDGDEYVGDFLENKFHG